MLRISRGEPRSHKVISCRNVVKLMLPWHYRIDQRVNRPLKIFLHRPANDDNTGVIVGLRWIETSLDRRQLLWYTLRSENFKGNLSSFEFQGFYSFHLNIQQTLHDLLVGHGPTAKKTHWSPGVLARRRRIAPVPYVTWHPLAPGQKLASKGQGEIVDLKKG